MANPDPTRRRTRLPDSQSRQTRLQPTPQTTAGDAGSTEIDKLAALRSIVEKEPWLSPFLKIPDDAAVASKTGSKDVESRSGERRGRRRGIDGTDDTTSNDTDNSEDGVFESHRPASPEAPPAPHPPPSIAPGPPTTPPHSCSTTIPPNTPSLPSDTATHATPEAVTAGASGNPPPEEAIAPGETGIEPDEGPSSEQRKSTEATGASTPRRGKGRRGRQRKKQ